MTIRSDVHERFEAVRQRAEARVGAELAQLAASDVAVTLIDAEGQQTVTTVTDFRRARGKRVATRTLLRAPKWLNE